MRLRVVLVAASLGAVAALAACTLNPQPLPPGDGDPNSNTGASSSSSTGGGAFEPGSRGGGEHNADVPAPADIDGGTGGDAASDGSSDAHDSG
jgi:hypothetical protein